jgi:hypothetical protein
MLSAILLNVTFSYCYAKYRYAECRSAVKRAGIEQLIKGTKHIPTRSSTFFKPMPLEFTQIQFNPLTVEYSKTFFVGVLKNIFFRSTR